MTGTTRFCVLVIAKAPVPGLAKTRLCPPATREGAAEIAVASLLDTLETVLRTPGAAPIIALSGELAHARRSAELAATLDGIPVIGQGDGDLAARLARTTSHASASHPGSPVLVIGMDTPQVTPELLTAAASGMSVHDAVLGPATDGGWWLLGLREPTRTPALRELGDVAMSLPDTGARTLRALHEADLCVASAPLLSDVDTMDDAETVAGFVAGSRFASAVAARTRLGVA